MVKKWNVRQKIIQLVNIVEKGVGRINTFATISSSSKDKLDQLDNISTYQEIRFVGL